VILAADGRPYDFLREYFPGLELIRFPGVRITYPPGKNMTGKMLARAPHILLSIYREHRRLKEIVRAYAIDVVISDNRFGLWSKEVYSVYMTHQVLIKAPERLQWTEPWLSRVHRWFINHYDECWIPDLPGHPNLSGDLGHKYPLPKNSKYTGLLSRFENPKSPNPKSPNPQIPKSPNPQIPKSPNLFLLSGPEPQRSIFENIILKELAKHPGLEAVILRGLPGEPQQKSPFPGVEMYNHLPDIEMVRLIREAGLIICRPGYSTLMDLAVLGRNAVLVPTPGQTEQEYLASNLTGSGPFYAMSQEGFSLDEALREGARLKESRLMNENDGSLLSDAIGDLPEKVRYFRIDDR